MTLASRTRAVGSHKDLTQVLVEISRASCRCNLSNERSRAKGETPLCLFLASRFRELMT